MADREWLILDGLHYRRTEDGPADPPWTHVTPVAFPVPQYRGIVAIRDAEIEVLKTEVSRLRRAITCHQEHMLETAEEVVGADRALWKVLDGDVIPEEGS